MVASFSRLIVILVAFLSRDVSSFSTIRSGSDTILKLSSTQQHQRLLSSSPRSSRVLLSAQSSVNDDDQDQIKAASTSNNTRRSMLQQAVISTSAILSSTLLATGGGTSTSSTIANAAMGTLPEFEDTNAIFQGVTIDVADKAQYEETIQFFTNSFDGMTVLRERGGDGGGIVRDTVSR
eukprot:scaffold1392_cov86-Skeletonema_menzelii.AAC.7